MTGIEAEEATGAGYDQNARRGAAGEHDSGGAEALECLPIIAVQYLMALRSNNILIPIGVGFAAWVGALAAVSSKVAIWWPYGYTIVHYLRDKPKGAHFAAYTQLHWLAFGAFVLLTLVSHAAFVMRRERG